MADPKPITKLGTSVTVPMLDDQKALMHVAPLDAEGNPSAFPTGSAPPVYTVDNGALVTLDPTVDPTGLSCEVIGVKELGGASSGVATVTATFTNADGTTAVGTAVFNMTVDPAELDVTSLDVAVDTPVSQ